MKCSIVTVSLKDNLFTTINRQKQIFKTDLYQDISNVAVGILKENYIEGNKVRAITIAVSGLENPDDEVQLDLFNLNENIKKDEKKQKLEIATKALDEIKEKYGKDKVKFASLLNNEENLPKK